MKKLVVLMATCAMLGGCDRLSRVGVAPDFSPMVVAKHDGEIARQISIPMPVDEPAPRAFSSLWSPGNKEFFVDVRAKQIGDIVTVLIDIDDRAKLNNTSQRSREASEDASLQALFGLEDIATDAINELELTPAVQGSSRSRSRGSGDIDRKEQIRLRIAAVVIDVLPNGNLAISGRQEVLVNYEMRDLRVAGVIRPMDINAANEIGYKDIAEARIAYGGRGMISDVQQPRYGQQVYDIVMPW